MEKFNKDQIYVVNRPNHPIVSIVVSNWETFPVSSKIHDNIIKLSENTDTIFLFSDNLFPSSKRIMKGKFTSLYKGCSFLSSSMELPVSIIKILLYCKEIFNHHLGYLICNGSDLENTILDDDFFKKVLEITDSSIVKPIYKLRRLSERELFSYYSRENNDLKMDSRFIERFIDRFDNHYYVEKEDVYFKYCNYTTNSTFMYFKNGIVNKILRFNNSFDELIDYSKTFTSSDFRYFLSNLVKVSGIDNLDMDIEYYGKD